MLICNSPPQSVDALDGTRTRTDRQGLDNPVHRHPKPARLPNFATSAAISGWRQAQPDAIFLYVTKHNMTKKTDTDDTPEPAEKPVSLKPYGLMRL